MQVPLEVNISTILVCNLDLFRFKSKNIPLYFRLSIPITQYNPPYQSLHSHYERTFPHTARHTILCNSDTSTNIDCDHLVRFPSYRKLAARCDSLRTACVERGTCYQQFKQSPRLTEPWYLSIVALRLSDTSPQVNTISSQYSVEPICRLVDSFASSRILFLI